MGYETTADTTAGQKQPIHVTSNQCSKGDVIGTSPDPLACNSLGMGRSGGMDIHREGYPANGIVMTGSSDEIFFGDAI
jgi:hypothetical protein